MKKIFLLMVLALTVVAAQAQTALNRTPRTKVSDALALLPAQDGKEYTRLMNDLVSSGAEGVDMLTSMFDDTNNQPVVYALSGWSAWVSDPSRQNVREVFASGIVRALQKSNDPEIRAFYIRLLQQCGGSESVKVLTDLLTDPRLGDPARCALESITAARDGFPVVYADAPVSRISQLYGLVQSRGAASMPQLLKAATDADRSYRNMALEFATPYADEAFYKQLIARLGKAKSPEVKSDLVTYLGLQGAGEALPSILSYFNNSNEELSIAAMWAATRLGGAGVNERLLELLGAESTPDAVRTAAAECLLSARDLRIGEVASVAGSGSPAGRVAALSILGAKQNTDQASLVIAAAEESDPQIRTAAYNALKGVVSAKELPQACTLLEKASTEDIQAARQAVVAALSRMPAAEQLAAVQARMASAGSKASRYYGVLAATGQCEVLDIIAEGYRTGDLAAKSDALSALQAWKGDESIPYLYDIAKTKDVNFDAALNSYITCSARSAHTREMRQILLSEGLDLARTSEQKAAILQAMGGTHTLQALVTAGSYLTDPDPKVSERASHAIYTVVLNRKDLTGPLVRQLAEAALEQQKDNLGDYSRPAVIEHLKSLPEEGGFVSLFNGKDLTGWKGLVDDPIKRAAMTPAELAKRQAEADEIMRRDWQVIDGLLTYMGKGYENLCTEKPYGDFELYLDWLLYPDGPSSDGGIYLRGTPQVQMWDTARQGAEVGSGGLYNNKNNPDKPLVKADNRMGHWNTFHIKMVGDRVTVHLNGVLVTDNVILENYWNRKLPIPASDQIELQAHSTRLAFRNIYIKELERPEPFRLSEEEQREGFRVLFDGQNMNDWMGNTRDYVIEDGEMVLYPGNGGKGNLYTKDEFGNFVFRFEFKLTPGANNGLGIRTPAEGDAAYVGMELQILDNTAPIYSQLEPYQYHASVYGVIPAKRGALNPVGEWNYQEVIANGNHIKITLNGTVIVDGDIAKASNNGKATMDGKEHPGLLNKKGHIGFLGHGSKLWFRNIRIKELK